MRCGAPSPRLGLVFPKPAAERLTTSPPAGATLVPSPEAASPPFDVLLFNPSRHLTESSISNVAFRTSSCPPTRAPETMEDEAPFVTPRRECGLLEGVMRAELLESGQVVEGVVTVDEVRDAARVRPALSLSFIGPDVARRD